MSSVNALHARCRIAQRDGASRRSCYIVWNYDEEVGQILTEYARTFIGKFDSAIQDKLANKNAEELMAKVKQ